LVWEGTRTNALEFWVKGFGREGLKSYVLDARLEEMNAAANEWVRLLSGGTIWVRFESQTATQTGKLSEKLNVRCWRYNPDGTVTERNYESWSGGEKARLDLGIDFGLARLVAARATKRYEMVVLDEVFRHLDAAGRDAVMELLQIIAQEKSSIFVIDHDAEFRGAFEHLMVVRKQNGQSAIVS
jgi:DNA repair exonuclease SbcCD ATPase subunit